MCLTPLPRCTKSWRRRNGEASEIVSPVLVWSVMKSNYSWWWKLESRCDTSISYSIFWWKLPFIWHFVVPALICLVVFCFLLSLSWCINSTVHPSSYSSWTSFLETDPFRGTVTLWTVTVLLLAIATESTHLSNKHRSLSWRKLRQSPLSLGIKAEALYDHHGTLFLQPLYSLSSHSKTIHYGLVLASLSWS